MNNPIFNQLNLFAMELLRMIDEGQTASIIEVCDNIENGTITEFICTQFGFKNVNVTLESIADVNKVMKEKDISVNKAHIKEINNNGLVYLVNLIVEDLTHLLYSMRLNRIDPETFRD